jgi:cysteinyl-tRNA synthetase
VVVFDVIARFLKFKGYEVTYVRNFTDIDDKIIDRAKQLDVTPRALAEKYIREFHRDMDALNVERVSVEPKATEHVVQIIAVIEKLIDNEVAYSVNGDVFYAVERFKAYGQLSGQRLEDMEAGARVEVDERKQNPFDFALWKSAKEGEPFWESPWGKGRPGWHIECSAMSTEYLGETFDIHGGGKDLIFPHHENEIAQSEAAFGSQFVKFWIHNGFVNIHHEKMSKSLGNFLLLSDILQTYHPDTVRLFLLSNHYRSPIDYTDKAMNNAQVGLDKIYTLLDRIQASIGSEETPSKRAGFDDWDRFCESMKNDFNTAQGIGILFEAVRHMNRLLDENSAPLSREIKQQLTNIRSDILKIGTVLGILSESPKAYFENKRSGRFAHKSIDSDTIEKMIQERNAARKKKDWQRADEIRKALDKIGIILEDRPTETVWKVQS